MGGIGANVTGTRVLALQDFGPSMKRRVIISAMILPLIHCGRSKELPSAPSASVTTAPARAAHVYASTDGGASWRPSDSGLPAGVTVNDFAVTGEVVFAGTAADGVYVSPDRGATWRAAAALPDGVTTVNALATTPAVLLAGTRQDGVFASRDGGETWASASKGLASLEVRRLVAADGKIFAATNGGAFVSSDDAASWRHLVGSGQTNAVVVSRGALYVAEVGGIFRSLDDGRTWDAVHRDATPHNIAAEGEQVFAMLYGGGVVRTADQGRTWQSAQAGLPSQREQYTFQILAVGDRLFAAQWDGIYVSSTRGDSWQRSAGLSPIHAITDIIQVSGQTLLAAAVISAKH